ncbi:hypothetical protein [Actinorugispora endophytica]|uniref:Uncharacterized protein n=1 Tax=Actinorugispora endophytica TaxID=1605990 RepID=A0A4R6VE52_9ACTN|nr:hypothetical protein [Actinorugispora endophytica]TDQ55317.1 hypothetical protein EV190_101642 [Actinorugispora endophytica]
MHCLSLFSLVGVLLLAVVAPAPQVGPSYPVVRRPRHASPPRRQARAVPSASARIPDYARFAEAAEEHSGRWEVTYEHGDECPYHARHRVSGDFVATRDLALLDRALRCYVVPPADRSVARCRRGQARFAALTWT